MFAMPTDWQILAGQSPSTDHVKVGSNPVEVCIAMIFQLFTEEKLPALCQNVFHVLVV